MLFAAKEAPASKTAAKKPGRGSLGRLANIKQPTAAGNNKQHTRRGLDVEPRDKGSIHGLLRQVVVRQGVLHWPEDSGEDAEFHNSPSRDRANRQLLPGTTLRHCC